MERDRLRERSRWWIDRKSSRDREKQDGRETDIQTEITPGERYIREKEDRNETE